MAVPKPVARTNQDVRISHEATSDPLSALVITATQRELDRYDDCALLSQQQARLVAKVKRVVQGELRRDVPQLLAKESARRFSRMLGEYVLNETRKQQFAAFERWLAAQYGPLEPINDEEFNSRLSEVNGIRIFRVDPPSDESIATSKA